MAKSSKRLTLKMTPGKQRQLARAVADVRAHYGPVLDVWRTLSDEQQRAVLAHSPLLAQLLAGVV